MADDPEQEADGAPGGADGVASPAAQTPSWGGTPPSWTPAGSAPRTQDAYAPGPYAPGPYAQGPYAQGPYAPPQGNPYATPTADAGYRYSWPYVPPPAPRAPVSQEERRRQRGRMLVLAAAILVALGAGIGIGAAIAPASPGSVAASLLTRSMSAATAAGSYRYVELSTALGARDDIAGVALASGGSQVIRQRCRSGTNTFDLRLVRGAVYFRGNTAAVVDQLGLSTARAGTLVSRWIVVTKGEKPYSSFADGITTKSNISQLPSVIVPRSTRSVSGSSPPETEIVGALSAGKGKAPVGTAALVVTTSGSLPQTLHGSAVGTTGRYEVSWTFSHYGTHATIKVPSGAVPYASLHASPPSKSSCV